MLLLLMIPAHRPSKIYQRPDRTLVPGVGGGVGFCWCWCWCCWCCCLWIVVPPRHEGAALSSVTLSQSNRSCASYGSPVAVRYDARDSFTYCYVTGRSVLCADDAALVKWLLSLTLRLLMQKCVCAGVVGQREKEFALS